MTQRSTPPYPRVQPATRQELADYLGVSISTFTRRIKKAKLEITTGLLTQQEQKTIVNLFCGKTD